MEQEEPRSRPSPKVRRMNVDSDVSASASHAAAPTQEAAAERPAAAAAAPAEVPRTTAEVPEAERSDAAMKPVAEAPSNQKAHGTPVEPTAQAASMETSDPLTPTGKSAPVTRAQAAAANARGTVAAGAPGPVPVRSAEASNVASAGQHAAATSSTVSSTQAPAPVPQAAPHAQPAPERSMMLEWNKYFYELAEKLKWREIREEAQKLNARPNWRDMLYTEPDLDVVVYAWHALAIVVMDERSAPLLVYGRADHPLVDAFGRAVLLQREQPRRKDWGNAMYCALSDGEQLLVNLSAPVNVGIVGIKLQFVLGSLHRILRYAQHQVRLRCLEQLEAVYPSLSVAELTEHLHMSSRDACNIAMHIGWTLVQPTAPGGKERLLRPKREAHFSSKPVLLWHILFLTDQVYTLES